MNIKVTENEKECILAIEGRVDTMTAPQLEEAVAEHADSRDKMIIDLSDTEYISSAGLRVVLIAHREMEKKGGLILRHPSKNVASVFKMTGFSRSLCIEE